MNGADSLIRTLIAGGVDICFTNPGTSEMHFVAALDRQPGLRSILTLFEGVASGAADGYGRMAGKPAATLLHTGPGLANALANFHNARKARTPIVNIVGDHATSHQRYDAPLSSDVAGFAAPVSGWVRSSVDANAVAGDAVAALAAAAQPPGQVATLILPADCAWNETAGTATPPPPPPPRRAQPKPNVIAEVARALRTGESAVIFLSGQALLEHELALAGRVAAATGARLLCQTFNPRHQRGAGRIAVEPLPYFAESAIANLAGTRHLILAGAQPPVSFFAYPDTPSWLTPDGCAIHTLAAPEDDAQAALTALVDELGAGSVPMDVQPALAPELPTGALTPEAVHRSIAAQMPEHAIVSDEAITGGFGMLHHTRGAPPHDWLQLTGGSIGQGLPLATGAATACPDRKVICLEGDGSAMYTIQSLWTQAREGLDVTNIVFANRRYAILEVELARVGAQPGPQAQRNYSIGDPDLDFVALARGLGVPAARVTTADEFNARFAAAMSEPGPSLIEVPF
ncbi:MAG: acetolactate synthase large subunit [Deltaproteobacteria bacterium]|nr:acetolactate synthase large subunit [Deltaproteobacteria bacterium]